MKKRSLAIARNMGMPYFLRNLDGPIGSKAINEFLLGRGGGLLKTDFRAHESGMQR